MSTDRTTRCGFIGLGSQGAPMAERMIAAGFPTVLWARRPESLERFANSGATFASSIAELAESVDHVGICVMADDDVREVCDILIPALSAGATIAVHSTVHPETVREVARKALAQDIHVIDAPVSGGEPGAKAGTLTVMLGGPANVVEKLRPIFSSFGALMPHLGEVGAGQNAKLVNNALLAANMAVADHALAAAAALKIDQASILELLSQSSGRSFGLEVRGRMPAPQAFNHGGMLLMKDLKLLCSVLDDGAGAAGLWDAAGPFLTACTSQPLQPQST